ncbi:MAG: hypothetical protein KGJ13_12385, partial [Patescibacteria group bacterium]|nr:hypothetical protein [Patescibacteria group bacterium]
VPKNDGRCVPVRYANWCLFFRPINEPHEVFVKHRPSLGFIGSSIRIEGVGDFRTTAIDLRRVDTINSKRHGEVLRAGYPLGYDSKTLDENLCDTFKRRYLADNPGAAWGDWAWFITAERIEQ